MNEYPDCFVKQTIEHDPESGNWGNCFSAVLASLLDIPIETSRYSAETVGCCVSTNSYAVTI